MILQMSQNSSSEDCLHEGSLRELCLHAMSRQLHSWVTLIPTSILSYTGVNLDGIFDKLLERLPNLWCFSESNAWVKARLWSKCTDVDVYIINLSGAPLPREVKWKHLVQSEEHRYVEMTLKQLSDNPSYEAIHIYGPQSYASETLPWFECGVTHAQIQFQHDSERWLEVSHHDLVVAAYIYTDSTRSTKVVDAFEGNITVRANGAYTLSPAFTSNVLMGLLVSLLT